jgi:hypothetical protein
VKQVMPQVEKVVKPLQACWRRAVPSTTAGHKHCQKRFSAAPLGPRIHPHPALGW